MATNMLPAVDVVSQAKQAQDASLQKMLAAEKMRSEQHRMNYQTLQAEHQSLQDEYVQLQNETRETIEENKLMQGKYSGLLEQAKKEKVDMKSQVDDLKTQVMTPQRLEVLKMQISEELEQPFRDRFLTQEVEVEKYRVQYNQMRKEYSFLKSEYEHEQVEHHRLVEEMTLKHEAEVINLRKERESFALRQQADVTFDTQKVRTLQRENAQLLLKLKAVTDELEEVRSSKEYQGLASESVTRVQAKQLCENVGNLKALKTEKDSLQLQCENLQRELSLVLEQNSKLISSNQDLEKECMQARNKVEEVTHRGKVEVTNVKMEMMRSRGELERECDRLKGLVADFESQVEITTHTNKQQAQSLIEKEQECVKRVQVAREEEWTKLTQIENEKLELEAKIQEIERKKIDDESFKHLERERIDERIRAAEEAKVAAEKECFLIKSKTEHLQSVMDQLQTERAQNEQLKNKLHETELQLNVYISEENNLLDENNKLQNELDLVTNEMRKFKDALSRAQQNVDDVISHHRASWEDEKLNMKSRIDELEENLANAHSKVNNAAVLHKKQKNRYQRYARNIKDKYQLCKAKMEQLELEKKARKNNVPLETVNKLKNNLKELWRRHTDYRAVLLSSPSGNDVEALPSYSPNFNKLPMPDFTSSTKAVEFSIPVSVTSFEEEELFHQQDLAKIRRRLESLDSAQKQQMEDLQELALRSIPEESLQGSPDE